MKIATNQSPPSSPCAARSSVVSVQISISDANDNAPEFARDTFTTTVSELQGVAEPAYTVSNSSISI